MSSVALCSLRGFRVSSGVPETSLISGSACRNDERLSSSRREGDTITLCVVAIVCIFIVCQTPALFNQVFYAVGEPEDRDCGRFHFYYTRLSDVLVVLNSSCNFAVYCLFGPTFRRNFIETVQQCCCCRSSATVATGRRTFHTATGGRGHRTFKGGALAVAAGSRLGRATKDNTSAFTMPPTNEGNSTIERQNAVTVEFYDQNVPRE